MHGQLTWLSLSCASTLLYEPKDTPQSHIPKPLTLLRLLSPTILLQVGLSSWHFWKKNDYKNTFAYVYIK